MRILGDQLHIRPGAETFHEFLVALVQWTLGVDWWKHQIKTPHPNRHVAVHWKFALTNALKRAAISPERSRTGKRFVADASGPAWALLSFGFDLYCLLARNNLPDFLIQRLRRNRSFQGARYEVAVASIMTRADYDVEFLDDHEQDEKHCEFIAIHRPSRLKVAVEAKSRVRRGALHEKGEFAYSRDVRGIAKLLRHASRQRPKGMPFFIFVDMNLPLSPETVPTSKPWVADIRDAIDSWLGTASAERPDPFACLIATNFTHYFGRDDGNSGRGEWGMLIPQFPEVGINDRRGLDDLCESLSKYDRIPDEI
jgi:hypothetical protein